MFDWNDIRIFLAVAAEGSTLAASKKLGINQTTVSRRVQVLEQALGLALFDRDTRGYALTTQGTALIEVAGYMDAAASSVSQRAKYLARVSEGKIRVTAAQAVMNHWVLPLISSFRQVHPDIHFETHTDESYVSLEDGEADVAFRASDNLTGDTLIARKLAQVKWGMYCNEKYAAKFGAPASIAEMSEHRWLSYPRPMIDQVPAFKWLDQYCESEKVVSTVDSVVTMSSSLRTEQAVGLLPCFEGDSVANLVKCFSHEKLISQLWLVVSKEAYQQPRVFEFMKYAAKHFPKD